MKKEYESTIEEAVHASYRLAELIGTVRRYSLLGMILVPFLFFGFYNILSGSPVEKVSFATVMSIIYIPGYLGLWKRFFRRRIHRVLVEARGTDEPVPTEYEIDESGLTCRQLGMEFKFSWETVQQLEVTDDSIEIIMKPTAIAIIPKRLFQEPGELGEWISFIKDHTGSCPVLERNPGIAARES